MKLLLVLPLFAVMTGHAAFEPMTRGSAASAMGGASIAVLRNPWSAFVNPAGVGSIDTRTISVFYSPQPFGLTELSQGSLSYVEPFEFGSFALSASRFGFAQYREIELQLSFGGSVSDILSIGGSIHYYSLAIERYGSAVAIGGDIGMLARVTESLQWGFAATNVNAPVIGRAREKLPQTFSTGLAYQPMSEATLALDVVKDVRFPVEVRAGLQYVLLDILALRAGTTQQPSLLSAGIGVNLPLITFDYAFMEHAELGPTHQFSLSFMLGEL
jgi:hypothetical protein